MGVKNSTIISGFLWILSWLRRHLCPACYLYVHIYIYTCANSLNANFILYYVVLSYYQFHLPQAINFATCNILCRMQYTLPHAIYFATCNILCRMQYTLPHAIYFATCNILCQGYFYQKKHLHISYTLYTAWTAVYVNSELWLT